MSKYCPSCKNNFSDSFDECVYCGTKLEDGMIETEYIITEKKIYEMSDVEILEKYYLQVLQKKVWQYLKWKKQTLL